VSRKIGVQEREPHGAPRWYVGFSTLTTILMTFFIMMTVNMTQERQLGYAGVGAGAFQRGFNSHGMPGVLRGARRIVDFLTWGSRFIPEDTPEGPGEVYTGRLIEMPERDLKQALSRMASSRQDVILPLPLRPSATLDGPAKEQLAAAARMIRRRDDAVLVCAALPPRWGGEPEEKVLCRATEWALLIARELADSESVSANRLTAVGRIAPESKGNAKGPSEIATGGPTVMLVMRPRVTGNAPAPPESDPLLAKPVTRYEIVR